MSVTLYGIALHVADFEKSKEFYSRIPGAELLLEVPGEFAQFRIGTAHLNVVKREGPEKFHIEIEAKDVDGAYQELRGLGFDASEPVTHPWKQRDFEFTDPDGNILQIGKFPGS